MARARVVTFNVQYARDVPRLAAALQRVPELAAADALLVQEVEDRPGEPGGRAEQLARALGLRCVYAPSRPTEDGGTHGLAVLSRAPATDVAVLPLPNPHPSFAPRIALAVTLDLGVPLRLYNVHLDTRIAAAQRAAQVAPVVEAARRDPVERVAVGGDFNAMPFSWIGRVFPVPGLAAGRVVERLFTGSGFAAPLRRAGHTHRVPVAIDAIYTRGLEPLAGGVARAVKVSDHYPLWLDVSW